MKSAAVAMSAATVAALLITAADALARGPKCLDRDGRCMIVQVNGQQSVKLSKQRKKELESVKATSSSLTRYEITQTKYELATVVRGGIDVRAHGIPGAEAWFGDLRSVDVGVVPLQNTELNTRQELATSNTVRSGGSSIVAQQNVLEGNKLPPGKYLLVVTLHGTSNWDRQVLYFEVAEK
jgi:hypothetical protein